MDAPPHLLAITPQRPASGTPVKLALGVTLFPQVLLLGVLVLLAVYFPFARVLLGVWALLYAFIAVRLVRTLRHDRRGTTQTPTLWLSSDSLGFTDRRGVTVCCRRTDVTSALRVFATVNRQTRELLVFRDSDDKALLSTPRTLWQPEDIDRITEALGIEHAHRKFVNSAAELETTAHGVPQPPLSPRHVRTAGSRCLLSTSS
jgi:hypothetical protein